MNKKLLFPGALLLAILYTTIGGLAYKSGQELEEVVTQQFSDQQLILAGKIGDDIRGHFLWAIPLTAQQGSGLVLLQNACPARRACSRAEKLRRQSICHLWKWVCLRF